MSAAFEKIALAVAFSPTAEAMLAEAVRLVKSFGADLVLIHVGTKNAEREQTMNTLLKKFEGDLRGLKISWETGEPVAAILKVCNAEKVDLLITGALKKENLVQHYVGTIARKILRQAKCSVLTIVNPSVEPSPYRNIVVNAEDSPFIVEAISAACFLGQREQASWVHIVRELKLYGLTMAASDQYTEEEYDDVRQHLVKLEIEKVEELMQRIPHAGLKINIKMVSGKSGFELSKFSERKHADLLVTGAPPRKLSFFDRVFPHDLEYIFADLPCNLLVVQQRKEGTRG